MKSKAFWAKRFIWLTGMVFMVLMAVDLLKGGSLEEGLSSAFGWALVSAGIFTATRYHYASKGVACAMCEDTVRE